MNSIRHSVPNVIERARGREQRLLWARTIVAAALVGAAGCADSGVAEPFVAVDQNPYTVAPDSLKRRPLQTAGLAPSASKSAAVGAVDAEMSVSSIAFNPEPGPFTTGRMETGDMDVNDDFTWGGLSGFDIGFNFTFYGMARTKFWIGSNGAILFNAAPWGACCYRWIPSDDDANDMIALALTDLRPADGQITYAIRGAAPNRRLIVNFDRVPLFNEMGVVTTQAILFEGTNVIEIHTTSQSPAQEYTQGVENATGSHAAFVADRVLRAYGLTNDAVRFTPVAQNAAPTVDAGGTAGTAPKYYEGVEGVAVQFNGRGADVDDDQLTYSWDFDADGIADATTPDATHVYRDNGEYTARLTVEDGRGGIGQASVQVKVSNATPQVSVGADVRIKAGETVNFSGLFSDQGVDDASWGWTWNVASQGHYFGTTPQQGMTLGASHRFCSAGSFPVKLTVTDKNGSAGSDDLLVTVDAISLSIDISPRTINLNDRGLLIVRAFSRPDLDATALNPSSIVLTNGTGKGTPIARTGGGLLHWNATFDVNGDGLRDVVMLFRRDQLLANKDVQMATTKLMLKGTVGTCGEALGSADMRVRVKARRSSAGSSFDSDSDSDG
jgi:hypothetical protein